MSRESRQRLREEAKYREKRLAREDKFRWILLVMAFVLVAIGAFTWVHLRRTPPSIARIKSSQFHQPQTLKELLALPPADLDKCDIGLMNLLCAEGLPGAENLDVQDCLKKLDDLAATVKFETDRHYYRFREHPEHGLASIWWTALG